MKKRYSQTIGLLALLFLAGCGQKVDSPQGFQLPRGDPDAGREAFVAVGCTQCHSVKGESFPELASPPTMDVQLGGDVRRVKTYAQLVTSIIYPSQSIKDSHGTDTQDSEGNSLMPDLTANLTVRQLIDITQYLQLHYNLVLPDYHKEYIYHP